MLTLSLAECQNMDERRKDALKKYRHDLRTRLVVEDIVPAFHLFLTDLECSRITDRTENIERVDELIDILLTKENKHYEGFCVVLKQRGYDHLAKNLQDEIYQGKPLASCRESLLYYS